jgi:hypothetical protein
MSLQSTLSRGEESESAYIGCRGVRVMKVPHFFRKADAEHSLAFSQLEADRVIEVMRQLVYTP